MTHEERDAAPADAPRSPPVRRGDLSAVVVRSQRLLLRTPRAEDAAAIVAGLSDWPVVRMLAHVPWPYGTYDAEAYLAGAAAALAAGTDLHLVITDGSGVLGAIGLHAIDEPGHFGFWLGHRAWGRGIMTEAASAALAFAFDGLGLAAVPSGYFADNAASARVQQKLGFAARGRSRVLCAARGAFLDHVDTFVTAAAFREARR